MRKVSVQCRHVGLAFGATEVLKDVNLDVEPGEFFALLGPSGSGKSTLLRLIAGFNQHQRGELLIDGVDVSGRAPWERNVGMVFQNYALWPHLTVWDNVAFGLVERKVERAEIRRRVGAALELVGLADYGERRPNQLSGGQQQRVALARTIVVEPQVLLLDEPLSNLDKTLRVQMRRELLAMQRRLGLTTIFVTHDQEEAMTTADRMAVLDRGVVQQVGAPLELYDEPANAFVAGFVGTMNMLPGRVRSRAGDSLVLVLAVDGAGDVALPRAADAPEDGDATLGFRPHTVEIAAAQAPLDPRRAWMDGTIGASEFLGEFVRYRIDLGPHPVAVDCAHRAGQPTLAVGSAVRFGIDPAQVRWLRR